MFDPYCSDIFQTNTILSKKYVKNEVNTLLLLYKELTDMFKLYNKITFGEFLIELYNIEPNKYVIIEKYILKSQHIVGIGYNNEIIWFEFFNDLINISTLKNTVRILKLKNKSFIPKRMKRAKARRSKNKYISQLGGSNIPNSKLDIDLEPNLGLEYMSYLSYLNYSNNSYNI
jgi:hypothetical protein